jgi:tryptophan-rich sensory protein
MRFYIVCQPLLILPACAFMKIRSWQMLVGFLLVVTAVSAVGGAITVSSVGTWYVALSKPTWTPPGWLFGPVWTLLYGMMAVVAWRLWCLRANSAEARGTLVLWWVQLLLNTSWSFLFFGLRSPIAGLIDIVVLLGVILWIQIRLCRIERQLAWAWVPYGLWVGFATALNLSIWLRQG